MVSTSIRKFERRYFALVDIIGFSEKVRVRSELAAPHKLDEIYEDIKDIVRGSDFTKLGVTVEVTLFSDTIIISTPAPTQAGQVESVLSPFLWCIRRVAIILLQYGFLSRGCIIEDEIFHREGLVVGPAIIAAHNFESRVANFPRIIIVRSLREDVQTRDRFQKWVRQSEDGPMFLHVLYDFEKFARSVPNIGYDKAEKMETFRFILTAHATILRYLVETRDDPRHFEKNKWFAKYMEADVLKLNSADKWSAWPKPFDIGGFY